MLYKRERSINSADLTQNSVTCDQRHRPMYKFKPVFDTGAH